MSKKKRIIRIISILFSLLLIVALSIGHNFYQKIYANNVSNQLKEPAFLYIKSSASYDAVLDSLTSANILEDVESFKWVSEKKNYPNKVKGGRYEIKPGMSNNELVNMLRSGNQKALNLTFNNIRTKLELASKISKQLEFDSLELITLLNDNNFLKEYGFNSETVISMFIPNTYQFYWNQSAKSFFEKMQKEYKKFWTNKRTTKAKKLNMSKLEVSVLASIVQAEQSKHNKEKPKVAGLYINRLNRKMPLESDPTLVFAIGDFSIQRVLNKDKEIDSPYNTYKNIGLPPAPINLPEISSIDAVLNYEKHNYIFMCAKEDFSGFHNFSTNLRQHNIYAQRYRIALNKRGIKR
jgi:UPF0755 protein